MKRLLTIPLLAVLSMQCFAACEGSANFYSCGDQSVHSKAIKNPESIALINGHLPANGVGTGQSSWAAGGAAVITSTGPMQTVVMGKPQSTTSRGPTPAARAGFDVNAAKGDYQPYSSAVGQGAKNKGGKLPIGRFLLYLLPLL